MMLASRGFAYLSGDTAGRQMQYHDKCDCDIVPSWGKQTLKGYDPDKFAEMYQTAESASGESDYRGILRRMRQLYPEEIKDGFYPLTNPWPFDEVVFPRQSVWDHVLGNHAPSSTVPGKTRFPDDWSDEKIKWAVKETVVDPWTVYD
ncbi:VG15 protein [Bifidobacterium bohemicum]|uniref:VG15 protein n=1 Tax=Bifidobacterium bohemicum TaxID=638617 RepID=UPI000B229560|nr:hypothetical protein [Bifidobacterium bohemicum]